MCFFEETQSGSQSGPSRTPILHFWAPLLASRDPVGHQFSSFWHHVCTCREAAKITKKRAKNCFLWIWLPPDIGARLDPDWIPTGQKRCPKMQKLVPHGVPTGSWRDRDWIHRSARTHSRTYFPLPRPTLAPIFLFRAPVLHQYPPSCTKTAKAVLSQTRVLQDR